MKIISLERAGLTVALSEDEVAIIQNALNEVCNALEEWEFSTRVGAERDEALFLLREFSEVGKQMDAGG